jgi:superfamily II DNA or RNA helicase
MDKDKQGGDVFIVDNSDADWKVRRYLHDWADLAHAIDIATGYFEIGGLLALDEQWQKVDKFRVLMGDEASLRTGKAFIQALKTAEATLDESIEREKETNDFLAGVPAIVEAIRRGKIECRIYTKNKFHAKAYITHGRHAVVGSTALVGSSNFTQAGINENVELNVQLRTRVEELQAWYERHWEEAKDITQEVLSVIERHTREYTPFEVYVKALQEFCRGHELTASEWELAGPANGGSHMYPILDRYQQEGYQALLQIARRYGGAFLCDGVGLGKTFVGLMIIERLVMHEGKRVALFVPKTAAEDVWKPALRSYLPHVGGVSAGDFSSLVVFNHSDLGRAGDFPYRFDRVREFADAIVIDEAHHFRNPGRLGVNGHRPSRYRLLNDLIEGPRGKKEVFMLTATPINNRVHDFRHMAELFTRGDDYYFSRTLGVHSVRGHFVSMERELVKSTQAADASSEVTLVEAERVLATDTLFKALVVQRSRAYVKKSQEQQGGGMAIFPIREPPKVATYSVRKTYGQLLDTVEKAFHKGKPLFVLGIYYPYAYYKGPDESIDPFDENRQKQVCGLIRTQFLKRFESSAYAFEQSCNRLLLKLLAWADRHSETEAEKRRLERWKRQNADLIGYVHERQLQLWGEEAEEDGDEDLITEEMLEAVEYLKRDEYNVEDILADTFLDLDEIVKFLTELKKFKVQHDDKLKALIELLRTDPMMKRHKVLIFTEFAETARYLKAHLDAADVPGIEQIDSASKKNRGDIIRRFAPYYNGSSSNALAECGEQEIRILISTDILSEGLNLQDATRMINYDLHWNPVKLMQRIGRVDRRMNPQIEAQIVAEHPDQQTLRGQIAFWNFLPPEELETLLRLYGRVSHKTLQISKTLGIEGRKLLTPKDDYQTLRDFNHTYEGETTSDEAIRLELQVLLNAHEGLNERIDALPGHVFSGKRHPSEGTRAVFFCYRLPRPDYSEGDTKGNLPWTEQVGETGWYLYDLNQEKIYEEPAEIINIIRTKPDTPRHCEVEQPTLSLIRKKVENHVKNTFLKRMQAPVGVKPILKAWMELN